MRHARLEFRKTVFVTMLDSIYAFIISLVCASVATNILESRGMVVERTVFQPTVILIGLGAYAAYTAYRQWPNWRMRGRLDRLFAFATHHRLEFESRTAGAATKPFAWMTLMDSTRRYEDRIFESVVTARDWVYGDYTYAKYRRYRGARYKSYTYYYSIAMFELPRALPHVFFDSMTSRGKQFRFEFSREQRHSLEGNFDLHFVTYFPGEYTIDSMSFISPDVMEALMEAKNYDIEIIDNKLYLFGPREDMPQQLETMVRLGTRIRSQLVDNIVTYRDERLPYHQGRKSVALKGARLRRSWVGKVLPYVLPAVWIAVYIYIKFFL